MSTILIFTSQVTVSPLPFFFMSNGELYVKYASVLHFLLDVLLIRLSLV